MQITVPDFNRARVLVVGDVMLDRYWHGTAGRISPEAPVPVVQVDREVSRPGGAANVAINLGALGAQVTLVGLVGDDEHADILVNQLSAGGVKAKLDRVATHPTICKLRVLSQRQQLVRLDFERGFTSEEAKSVKTLVEESLDDVDVVIISDYAKGTLCEVRSLIKHATARQIPVLVDPKGTDWQPYKGATLLTPNLAEFAGVTKMHSILEREQEDSHFLRDEARNLMENLELGALLVTRGAKGMSLFHSEQAELHLPAHAQEVFDVTGAGDTVISLLGAGLATGLSISDATRLANLGASLVVAKVGAASVSPVELRAAAGIAVGKRGVVDLATLMALVASSRLRGERVVMTNGCFDILHAGHVSYLQSARALGDRLIVAVNDDASVQRLKGSGRPVMTLDTRMQVLAGLDAVDWVISFSEPTPTSVIEQILPDVLVKGGDYEAEEIAGYAAVTAAGGEVKTLEYIEGESTTAILRRIQSSVE